MRFSRTALTSLPLFLLACGGPDRDPPNNTPPPLLTIEKTSALEAANRNFRAVVVGAAHSGALVEEHELLELLAIGGASDPGSEAPSMEERANDLADELAARILTIANVEVEESTRIVLTLKPEVFCAAGTSTTSAGSCTQALTQVPVRMELTSRRENDIDAALSVGPYSVASVQFHRDRFGVELDFGAAMDAAKALANASGEPLEEIGGTIRGRVRAELLVNGDNDYTLSLSVISPIDIDATVNGETVSFDLGTSTPLASLRIDGNTPKLVFESNVGAIDMKVPLGIVEIEDGSACPPDVPECSSGDPEPRLTGTIGVRVESTSIKMTIDSSTALKIDRYSTGGARVTYDGTEIFSFSMNMGQPISGSVASNEAGTTISVSPMLDARAKLDLNSLADQLGEEFPRSLLRDTISILLNGSTNPTLRTRTVETQTVDPEGGVSFERRTLIEVVDGRLTLSSSAAGKTVVVEAGMCLDSIEPDPNETTDPHPFELFVAATCE